METIDPTLPIIVAVCANFIYQGLVFFNDYNDSGYFPWSNRPWPVGCIMFIFGTVLKLVVAGSVVWVLAMEGQVNGIIGAAIIGMASDEILINLATAGRKAVEHARA